MFRSPEVDKEREVESALSETSGTTLSLEHLWP